MLLPLWKYNLKSIFCYILKIQGCYTTILLCSWILWGGNSGMARRSLSPLCDAWEFSWEDGDSWGWFKQWVLKSSGGLFTCMPCSPGWSVIKSCGSLVVSLHIKSIRTLHVNSQYDLSRRAAPSKLHLHGCSELQQSSSEQEWCCMVAYYLASKITWHYFYHIL